MRAKAGVKQKKSWLLFAGILAISLLAGCAKAGGDDVGGQLLFGRGILYARASADEEVFPNTEALMTDAENGQIEIFDQEVPLAALPEIDSLEFALGDGWLLVRYDSLPSGAIQPTWVGVWSEGAGWLEAALDCGQLGLRLLDAGQES